MKCRSGPSKELAGAARQALGADYDVDDLLPKIRDALSVDGKLYAAPFYGESSMVMYRTDLMEKAGLKMPEQPDLGLHHRRREEDDRQVDRRLRHLPARQGRLGREHGVPDRHVELLRRPLVRREVAAAVQQRRNGRTRSPPTST